jgi:hypothetical protein
MYLFSALMLLFGIMSLPYAYYTLLRIVTSICALKRIIIYKKINDEYNYIALIILVIFNPLMPIHLSKSVWAILDFLVAAYFIYIVFAEKIK